MSKQSTAEVVATGLAVPEGPTLLDDGRVAFVEQTRGRVSVFDGTVVSTIAVTGDCPNSTALGTDGELYVCMNGGVVGPWRSPQPQPAGLLRITLDAEARIVRDGFASGAAPNDLAFGADGRLHVTDPAQPFDPADPRPDGWLRTFDPDGSDGSFRVGPVYPNGVTVDASGRVVWVESYTRAVCDVSDQGVRRILGRLPEGHVPDGLAASEDGRLFITSCGSHGITVLGPDGELDGFIVLDEDAHPTNCCFDGSALWVTDFSMDWAKRDAAGRLWRVETDAVGAPVHRGRVE